MPYIDKINRMRLIDSKAGTVFYKEVRNAGEFNFIISSMIKEYLDKTGLSYTHINDLIGTLECTKLELYRRLAADYEDLKIKQNGDVY